jgi:DNA polymerase III epsilon subunit-like protein
MDIFLYLLAGAILLFIVVNSLNKKDKPTIAPPPPTRNPPRPIENMATQKSKPIANPDELYSDFESADPQSKPYFLVLHIKAGEKPKSYDAPSSDIANWPKPIELAWMAFTQDGKLISESNHFFQRKEPLSDQAKKELLITDEELASKGESSSEIISKFARVSEQSAYLIGHNIDYHITLLEAEVTRMDLEGFDLPKHQYCLMKKGTNICKIEKPSGYGYKWPSMDELIATFFVKDKSPSNYRRPNDHSAKSDVRMMAKCFFKMNQK